MANEQSTQPSNEALLRFELYCTTRSEADKSILTLSTAGLGLTVTLLTGNKVSSTFELVLFILGALCFLICIFTVTKIFAENSKYIASQWADDSLLITLDTIAKYAFRGGIAFTAIASVVVSINNLTNNLNEQSIYEQQGSKQQSPIRQPSLRQGQLGGGECDLKTAETISETTESAPIKSEEGLSDMSNEKLTHDNMDTVKKSWEGANSILEQTTTDSSGNSSDDDSGSNSDDE